MVADNNNTLPDFADPPVNETVLSIQFAPVPNFGIPYFGLYWAKIRSEFGRFQVLPWLPSITEQFDTILRVGERPGVRLLAQPEVRCWFLDETGSRLIQVQRDRFIHNWRQVSGKEGYPRYPSIKKTLQTEWGRFCDFLKSENFELPQVNQCEVTYVNHIEYGNGWEGYGELSKVIASWSGRSSGGFLPVPEKVNIGAHYCLPNKLGRLHASVEPVIRARDMKEVLQLTLTARGAPKSSSNEDVFRWIDLGREWVVKGFTDFTTQSMHQIWGKKS